jgi:cystathionine beta-synthase
MFNDFWMRDQGFITHAAAGNLTDLVQRRYAEGSVVTVRPDDTLLTAFGRFKLYEVSQLPVLQDERVVGIIDESDVLHAVLTETTHFGDSVASVMSTRLETVQPDAPLARVMEILDAGMVAIVVDGERLVGLITRIDLLNHLRRRMKRP